MKKKIGTLRGKPIVEGDSNLVKKNEIDISTIGNTSNEDEYVYFCFPENTFINKSGYPKVKISEQTEEKQIILSLIITFTDISRVYTTIRTFYNSQVRYMDDYIMEDDDTFRFSHAYPLYLKISKVLEIREESGSADNIVTCIKGNYKNFISGILEGKLTGNELDQYLISKEKWDKAVEETYKNYNKIIEL